GADPQHLCVAFTNKRSVACPFSRSGSVKASNQLLHLEEDTERVLEAGVGSVWIDPVHHTQLSYKAQALQKRRVEDHHFYRGQRDSSPYGIADFFTRTPRSRWII